MASKILSEDDLERLLAARLTAGEASEEDLIRWIGWCEKARVAAAMVDGCIHGRFAAAWPAEAKQPTFSNR